MSRIESLIEVVVNKEQIAQDYTTVDQRGSQIRMFSGDYGVVKESVEDIIYAMAHANAGRSSLSSSIRRFALEVPVQESKEAPRCPRCRHAPHDGRGCLNAASDNDCSCDMTAYAG